MSEINKIDLSGDGGAVKEILQEGIGDEKPMSGCKVSLHYTGRLTDGTVFDSSVDRGEPFEFDLGRGHVIKAFDMGVASMRKGEKCRLTCAPDYAYGKAGSPPSIPPDSTLIFDLELLSWKGEDISPNNDGSIERVILQAAENRRTPSEGGQVKVHVVGKYEDRVFEDREVEFTLGEGSDMGIVEGVELALEKISVGETSRITLKSKYAFGSKGHEEYKIPANASPIVYDVKLLKCEKGIKEWKLNDEERLEQSKTYKEKGTTYLNKGNVSLAIKMYKKCLDFLTGMSLLDAQDALKDDCNKLKIAVHNNLALCYQKNNEDLEAKQECNEVLKLDENNIKALFRRGRCNVAINELEDALQDFQKVLELEPSNKAALNQITICKQKVKDLKDREKKIYANMFTKLAAHDKQPVTEVTEDIMSICGDWTEEDTKRECDYVFERDQNIFMI